MQDCKAMITEWDILAYKIKEKNQNARDQKTQGVGE